jgi:nitrate reductase alpha subunit
MERCFLSLTAMPNPSVWAGCLLRLSLKRNPLKLGKSSRILVSNVSEALRKDLKSGELKLSCHDPDAPQNWPRNMFVWRSNILGSSGKGHEYFLKHLLGTQHGVQGKDLGEEGRSISRRSVWHDKAPEGKLDLLVTLDFRMSTTCMYSDIVLPTATWYEKHDLNTSDMHPFIHPLSAAVDPAWESRTIGIFTKASPRNSLKFA